MYECVCQYDTDSGETIEFSETMADIHSAMRYCHGIAMMLTADNIVWTEPQTDVMTADHGRLRFSIVKTSQIPF